MPNWTEDDLAAHYERLKGKPPEKSLSKSDVAEAVIEAECTKILEADGWRALRTDPVSDRGRGKGFGEVGMADHLYIRYRSPSDWQAGSAGLAEVLWIEFKSSKGKPQKHQLEWITKERARGALVLVAGLDFGASVDGFRDWYRSSGLSRSYLCP